MKRRRPLTLEQAAALSRPPIKRAVRHRTQQGQRQAVRPRSPSETAECRTFIAWTHLVQFEGEPLFERVVKVANERGKAGVQTAILQSIGLRAGFPDYVIHTPAGPFHGLYLEAKRVSGGRVDREQIEWRDKLLRWGYQAQICSGAIELIDAVKLYMRRSGATAAGQFNDATRISR